MRWQHLRFMRCPRRIRRRCGRIRVGAWLGSRPCKPLADTLAQEGGIYAPLSADEERLLQAFHLVAQSHEGYQYEGAFDQLCQQAGLLHSDVGRLSGRVQTLFQQREPVRYEAEASALLHQWLRNKSSEHEEEEKHDERREH